MPVDRDERPNSRASRRREDGPAVRGAGRPPPGGRLDPDRRGGVQIAATALQHGLALVTGNLRHFERIPGLEIERALVDTRDG